MVKKKTSQHSPQPQKSNHRIPSISYQLKSGELIELVYDPKKEKTAFVVGNGKSWRMEKQIPLSKNQSLVPYSASNSLLRHNVILFPSNPDDYGSEQKLISEIQTYIKKYLSVSDEFLLVATYYVLFSWLYDSFNELPYLRASGDFGSGKTRFLLTVGSICYKPMFASGASTISPLFHMLDIFRGTLLIDEADFRVSDDKTEIVKILNNGNARGFPVLRSEQSPTNEYRPRAFEVFGPKLVATRNRYDDAALESRFVTEDMNQNIPLNLPPEHAHEALQMRNKLLLFRLRNFTGTREVTSSLSSVEPRLAQIFSPLISIIDDNEAKSGIATLVQQLDVTLKENRKNQVEVRLLSIICELQKIKQNSALSVGDICKLFAQRFQKEYQVRITPRWIGSLLRNRLGIRTSKKNGVYVIQPINSNLKIMYTRYRIDEK